LKVVKTKSYDTKTFIENSSAILDLFKLYSDVIPVVQDNKSHKNSSYVTSFIAQYILYTREEVLKSAKYTKNQKRLAKFVPLTILPVIKMILGNDIVWINNNITSTPLYNTKWDLYDIEELSEKLMRNYSNSVLIYKSVESTTNPELFQKFKSNDYIPLLGRQVYIFDPKSSKYKKKRSFQMDKKLSQKQDRFYWAMLDLDNDHEIERVLELYKKLYLDKHSIYNPIYTKAFVKDGFGDFRLRFEVLKDKLNSQNIVAVQGIHETDKVLNTSFIGYDQSLPQELGLYRLMNYELMRQAIEKGKILNMSSGAGDFKLKRGAIASFEYQMIYPKNLSSLQKKIWMYLAKTLEKTAKQKMLELKV
jgi:hypothetical protein